MPTIMHLQFSSDGYVKNGGGDLDVETDGNES